MWEEKYEQHTFHVTCDWMQLWQAYYCTELQRTFSLWLHCQVSPLKSTLCEHALYSTAYELRTCTHVQGTHVQVNLHAILYWLGGGKEWLLVFVCILDFDLHMSDN